MIFIAELIVNKQDALKLRGSPPTCPAGDADSGGGEDDRQGHGVLARPVVPTKPNLRLQAGKIFVMKFDLLVSKPKGVRLSMLY